MEQFMHCGSYAYSKIVTRILCWLLFVFSTPQKSILDYFLLGLLTIEQFVINDYFCSQFSWPCPLAQEKPNPKSGHSLVAQENRTGALEDLSRLHVG